MEKWKKQESTIPTRRAQEHSTLAINILFSLIVNSYCEKKLHDTTVMIMEEAVLFSE